MRSGPILIAISFCSLLGLSACAPISEEACRAQNWNAIGLRDGERGVSLGQFARYSEECAKYGIRPVQEDWQSGRELGLKTYCTPTNAYRVGRNGRQLNNVCSGNVTQLVSANRSGLEVHEIASELEDLRSERRDILRTLRFELNAPTTEQDIALRRQYRRLLSRIERLIENQELKLLRAENNSSY